MCKGKVKEWDSQEFHISKPWWQMWTLWKQENCQRIGDGGKEKPQHMRRNVLKGAWKL